MFDTVHDIDWAALRHAYGPADDVPGMLLGLTGRHPVRRGLADEDRAGRGVSRWVRRRAGSRPATGPGGPG